MSASDVWLWTLLACVLAVPATYVIGWALRRGRDRLKRRARGWTTRMESRR